MSSIAERRRANLSRRVLEMRQRLNMMPWDRRASNEFVDRLLLASTTEGIDDVDLRVLVRIFNRELIGRQHEQACEQHQKEPQE